MKNWPRVVRAGTGAALLLTGAGTAALLPAPAGAQSGLTADRATALCAAAPFAEVKPDAIPMPFVSMEKGSGASSKWQFSPYVRPRLGPREAPPDQANTLVCIQTDSKFEQRGGRSVLVSYWETWAVRVSDGVVLRYGAFVGDLVSPGAGTVSISDCVYYPGPPRCTGISATVADPPVGEVLAWLDQPAPAPSTDIPAADE